MDSRGTASDNDKFMTQTADLIKRLRLRMAWDTVHMQSTIAHAFENTDFYPSFWEGSTPKDFTSLDDLHRFPVLRKADVVKAASGIVSRVDPADAVRDTSGTTGVRLPVYISSAEDKALAELRRQRSEGHPRASGRLRILPPPRRLKPAVAPQGDDALHLVMHALPFDDLRNWWTNADFLMSVLSEKYMSGAGQTGVELIHCTPPPLFSYLTRQIQDAGVDPSAFGVLSILLTGGPLSSPARGALESAWHAAVTSTFSCTEIRGEALPCPLDPDTFHISHSAYCEVVGLDDKEVADGETGELVLTGFSPYQRVMPMIRYATGDIARRMNAPCACGSVARSFQVLGRRGSVVKPKDAHGKEGPPLPTLALLHAIEGLPQVPIFPFPRFQVTQNTQGGPVVVKVESVDPRCFDTAKVSHKILEDLRRHCPDALAFLARRGIPLQVDLVPKNSLSDFIRLYPGR